MKTGRLILFFLLSAVIGSAAAQTHWRDFQCERGAKVVEEPGEDYLEISLPGSRFRSSWCSLPVDLGEFAGKTVAVELEWMQEGISASPARPYFGVKCLFSYMHNGRKVRVERFQSQNGSSGWQPFQFEFKVLGEGVSDGVLTLGMQEASGTVRFRNLTIRPLKQEYRVELPENFRCEYTEAARSLPRLRGAMSPGWGKITAQDIRDLGSWGANVIRWQFNPPVSKDPEAYIRQLDEDLNRLEKLLPVLEEAGVRVIFDLHVPMGGRMRDEVELGTAGPLAKNALGSTEFRMAYRKADLDIYLAQWEKIARRFKETPTVAAYDLLNEPDQWREVVYDYLEIQYLAAQAIRRIDPEKPVIVTGNHWAYPNCFRDLQPLPLKNVIYTLHMYYPGEYTHQGVYGGNSDAKLTYPGEIGGKYIDRSMLREELRNAVAFQQKYGARIFVGEFSVIRWAPGGAQYLADCIDLFEENSWDWCYHAFREYSGWSVEHSDIRDDSRKSAAGTERKRVLLQGFEKNRTTGRSGK